MNKVPTLSAATASCCSIIYSFPVDKHIFFHIPYSINQVLKFMMQSVFQMFKQGDKSPQTPKAVHYFQHFPSNFLRPYGLADEQPPEEKIFRRVAPLNCEWLTRPKVAISEFADTITSNMTLLSESTSQFLRKSKFSMMQENLSSFLQTLEKFNTMKSQDKPNAGDVKNFLKGILEDDADVDNFFADMFQLGGAMYLLGAHYSVVKTLLSNPEWTAEKTIGTSEQVKNFKANPTIKELKKYLTDICTATTSTAESPRKPRKRNLAHLLDSDDEGEGSTAYNERTGQHEEEEEQHTTPKKNKKRKSQRDEL